MIFDANPETCEAFRFIFAPVEKREKYVGIFDAKHDGGKFRRKPYFIRKLENKIRKGGSPLLIIVGETNTGKSMLALLIAEHIQGYLNWLLPEARPNILEDQVMWTMSDMARELKNFEKSVLILEEGSTNVRFDSWNDIYNRAFADINSTQRVRRNCYILIVPWTIKQMASRHLPSVSAIVETLAPSIVLKSSMLIYDRSRVTGKNVWQPTLDSMIEGIPLPSDNTLNIYKLADRVNKDRILGSIEARVLSKEREFELKSEVLELRAQYLKKRMTNMDQKKPKW